MIKIDKVGEAWGSNIYGHFGQLAMGRARLHHSKWTEVEVMAMWSPLRSLVSPAKYERIDVVQSEFSAIYIFIYVYVYKHA